VGRDLVIITTWHDWFCREKMQAELFFSPACKQKSSKKNTVKQQNQHYLLQKYLEEKKKKQWAKFTVLAA